MVRSSHVEPFSEPPACSMSAKCAVSGTLAEPWNIMCSKRCAKPVRPGRSFRDPTPYHRLTATTGTDGSRDSTTLSPLPRLNRSNGI